MTSAGRCSGAWSFQVPFDVAVLGYLSPLEAENHEQPLVLVAVFLAAVEVWARGVKVICSTRGTYGTRPQRERD